MKALVMAAGAVGGYFGSVLARGGNEVRFIARSDNLRAIRESGLSIRSVTSGDFSVRAPVGDSVDGSWIPDLVLFCVKSYHNREAIRCLAPAVGPDTAILTLQNGIGSGDDLAAAFGAERVMLGAAYVEAAHPEPGMFEEHGGTCRIVFAEPDSRKSSRSVFDLGDAESVGHRRRNLGRHRQGAVGQAGVYLRSERDDVCHEIVIRGGDEHAADRGPHLERDRGGRRGG